MKVLLLSPGFDGTDVGEAYVSFKWAESLASQVDLTVLAFQRHDRLALAKQLPDVEVVTWPEPKVFRRAERFNAMLKPAYGLLYAQARKWIRSQQRCGRSFDIAHQLMPQAARYPSPFTGLGIPYVIGPLGGSLTTPRGFRDEVGTGRWYTKLRGIDQWRFRHDPWLRKSYSEAALVLGVAPYMAEVLSAIPLGRFEAMLELGIENLATPRDYRTAGELKLLHVGRGVRTKGLRDVVRALAHLKDHPDITLVSAGDGDEIDLARKEAKALGVADRVTFLGKVPRTHVEKLYESSDVFVFPSFREPAGGVLYEAMRAGLPIITVARGGPDFIIDATSGIKLSVSTPEALAADLAQAIRRLHDTPDLARAMGLAARDRVAREGLWTNKADKIMAYYREIIS